MALDARVDEDDPDPPGARREPTVAVPERPPVAATRSGATRAAPGSARRRLRRPRVLRRHRRVRRAGPAPRRRPSPAPPSTARTAATPNEAGAPVLRGCGYDFTTGQAPPTTEPTGAVEPEPPPLPTLDRVGRRRRGRSCVVRAEGPAGRSPVPATVVVDDRLDGVDGADRAHQPEPPAASRDRPRRRHRRVAAPRPARA